MFEIKYGRDKIPAMKYIASFVKYVSIEIDAETYDRAQFVAEFVLEQCPEECDSGPWFLQTIEKQNCAKSKDSVKVN